MSLLNTFSKSKQLSSRKYITEGAVKSNLLAQRPMSEQTSYLRSTTTLKGIRSFLQERFFKALLAEKKPTQEMSTRYAGISTPTTGTSTPSQTYQVLMGQGVLIQGT